MAGRASLEKMLLDDGMASLSIALTMSSLNPFFQLSRSKITHLMTTRERPVDKHKVIDALSMATGTVVKDVHFMCLRMPQSADVFRLAEIDLALSPAIRAKYSTMWHDPEGAYTPLSLRWGFPAHLWYPLRDTLRNTLWPSAFYREMHESRKRFWDQATDGMRDALYAHLSLSFKEHHTQVTELHQLLNILHCVIPVGREQDTHEWLVLTG